MLIFLKKNLKNIESSPIISLTKKLNYVNIVKIVKAQSIADMEFVKMFTQARFLKSKLYPKGRKSQ